MRKRPRLKIKYEPGYRYVDIDLTKGDEHASEQIEELGRMLGWTDESATPEKERVDDKE